MGCNAEDEQIMRERIYRVRYGVESLGVVDTNQTISLRAHSKELVRFETSPKAIILAESSRSRLSQRFNLTLLNKNLYTRVSATFDNIQDKFKGAFRHCLMAEETADLMPLHNTDPVVVAFECEFNDIKVPEEAKKLTLSVVDSFWHVVFQAEVELFTEPVILSIEPTVLLN